jgi:hypothetical protein
MPTRTWPPSAQTTITKKTCDPLMRVSNKLASQWAWGSRFSCRGGTLCFYHKDGQQLKGKRGAKSRDLRWPPSPSPRGVRGSWGECVRRWRGPGWRGGGLAREARAPAALRHGSGQAPRPQGARPPRRAGELSDQRRAGSPAPARESVCVLSRPVMFLPGRRSEACPPKACRRREPPPGADGQARGPRRGIGGVGASVTAGRRHSARVMSSRARAGGWACAWRTTV